METDKRHQSLRYCTFAIFVSTWIVLIAPDASLAQISGIELQLPFAAESGEQIVGRVISVGEPPIDFVVVKDGRRRLIASATKLPLEFAYVIPDDAIGPLSFGALAADSAGHAYQSHESVQVNVTAPLEALRFTAGLSNTTLSFVGARRRVAVTGDYLDGVSRDVSSADTGTIYTSLDPNIVSVLPGSILEAVDEGITQVVVTHGELSLQLDVEVKLTEPDIGERSGGGQGARDDFVTYSGPIEFGRESFPLPAKGVIELPINTEEVRFSFHNNTGLPQLGAVPAIVIADIRSGAPSCDITLFNNVEPPTVPPFFVINGEIMVTLPPSGGRCVFILSVGQGGSRDSDRLVLKNPPP